MQIELNKSEIELIDKALEIWEKESHSGAMLSAIFGTMLCPKAEREIIDEKIKKDFKKAEEEGQARRVKSIMLRAKLYQALSRDSEHVL